MSYTEAETEFILNSFNIPQPNSKFDSTSPSPSAQSENSIECGSHAMNVESSEYDSEQELTNLTWLTQLKSLAETDCLNPIMNDSPECINNIADSGTIPKRETDEQRYTKYIIQIEECRRSYENSAEIFRTDTELKPPFNYSQIIGMAMLEHGRMTLRQICIWIEKQFAYFRIRNNWNNSIRHNLSLQYCFRKINRDKFEKGKGGYWELGMDQSKTDKKRIRNRKARPSSAHLTGNPRTNTKFNINTKFNVNGNSQIKISNNGAGGNTTASENITNNYIIDTGAKRKRKQTTEPSLNNNNINNINNNFDTINNNSIDINNDNSNNCSSTNNNNNQDIISYILQDAETLKILGVANNIEIVDTYDQIYTTTTLERTNNTEIGVISQIEMTDMSNQHGQQQQQQQQEYLQSQPQHQQQQQHHQLQQNEQQQQQQPQQDNQSQQNHQTDIIQEVENFDLNLSTDVNYLNSSALEIGSSTYEIFEEEFPIVTMVDPITMEIKSNNTYPIREVPQTTDNIIASVLNNYPHNGPNVIVEQLQYVTSTVEDSSIKSYLDGIEEEFQFLKNSENRDEFMDSFYDISPQGF